MASVKRANTSGITKSGTAIADVPDAPTIGVATGSGLSASVTFTAAVTGGTPTSYTVTSTPGSLTGTGASAPITVSGLSDGTAYTFTVTATNSSGTSAASSASNSITAVVPISGAYDSLAHVKLTTTASSITFAGIPTGYKHLQIRMFAGYTGSVSAGYISFNGDTSSGSYSTHALNTDGVSNPPGVLGYTSQNRGYFTAFAGTSPAARNNMIMDIFDYSNTSKYKTCKAVYLWDANGSGYVEVNSNNWFSLSPISSITLTPGNTFDSFTSVGLYGVK